MSQGDFLGRIVERLGAAGIPHALAGSLASGFHGEPRATNDIDLVIAPTREQLDAFIDSLGSDYYVSKEAAHDALRNRSMFNIIEFQSGWKAHLIVQKDRPFSREEFDRRKTENLSGLQVPIVSPEDVILSKLEWSKISESERQIRDALGVAVVQWTSLDKEYLRKWAEELGIADRLEAVLKDAEARQAPAEGGK